MSEIDKYLFIALWGWPDIQPVPRLVVLLIDRHSVTCGIYVNHYIYTNFKKKTFKSQHVPINIKFQLILNINCWRVSFLVLYYLRDDNNNLGYHFIAYKRVSHMLPHWIRSTTLRDKHLCLYILSGKTRN